MSDIEGEAATVASRELGVTPEVKSKGGEIQRAKGFVGKTETFT
jgi:hypothetical protein